MGTQKWKLNTLDQSSLLSVKSHSFLYYLPIPIGWLDSCVIVMCLSGVYLRQNITNGTHRYQWWYFNICCRLLIYVGLPLKYDFCVFSYFLLLIILCLFFLSQNLYSFKYLFEFQLSLLIKKWRKLIKKSLHDFFQKSFYFLRRMQNKCFGISTALSEATKMHLLVVIQNLNYIQRVA